MRGSLNSTVTLLSHFMMNSRHHVQAFAGTHIFHDVLMSLKRLLLDHDCPAVGLTCIPYSPVWGSSQ